MRLFTGFLLLIFYSVLSKGCGYSEENPAPAGFEKPNILWLVAEDLSPLISCYGDSTVATPNLDRLAREGVRYTHCFDVSGVCAPSRSALITGMYPTYIGTNNMRTSQKIPEAGLHGYSVVLPDGVKMFSEWMRREGYYCTNNDKEDYQFRAPLSGWDESSKQAHWRNRPEGKPFFSVFNFAVSHESRIWMKEGDSLLVDPAKVRLPPYFPESPVIRRDVARMYSNVAEMDAQVGEILEQLEADGLLEKTIIFWYSDNGGPLPRNKREIYDSGIRIPLLIRFPGKKFAGTVDDRLISFVDFAPTVLSLADVRIPSYMQGQAFLGAQQSGRERRYVYAARDRMGTEYDMVRAVRDKRFKYIKNFQPEKPYIQDLPYRRQMGLMNELLRLEKEDKLNAVQKLWFSKTKPAEELYDAEADPYELNNLAGDGRYSQQLEEMRTALSNWMSYTQDKGNIPEREFVQTMWPGMVQPTTENPQFLENGNIWINCETPGASISWQMIDPRGELNKHAWQVYVAPVKLAPGKKLVAVAERIGYQSSDTVVFVPVSSAQ